MNKILNLLGLAKRAARLALGFDAALKAVKDGSAACILLATDISEKSLKEWRFAADAYQIPTQVLPFSKMELGNAVGLRREVGIVAVCDEGFAAAMQRVTRIQEEE